MRQLQEAKRDAYDWARRKKANELSKQYGNKLVLDEAEIAMLLASPGDRYKDAGMKPPFDYNPDAFIESDLSGRKIRHYIKLPDGKIGHPDEIHDSRQRGNLIVIPNISPPKDYPRFRADGLDRFTIQWLKKE